MKKYILSIIISMIVGNSLAYSQTLDPSLQWKFNGYASKGQPLGLATTDANNMMNMAVSGDVSNAPATALFSNSVARQIQSIISDTKTIKNYGAKLDDTQITTDMGIINSLIGSANSPQVLYMPTGIIWPHNGYNAIVPDAGTKNTVILAQGEINWWPSDPITDWNLGYSFPDFGSGVSALTYGTHGSFNFSRADVRGTSINTTIPNVNFDYYSDTPNQAGNAGVPGNVNVRLHTITGKNKRGMAAGINDIFDSMSYGYYGDDDVQDWHHMGIWGTDWTWSNIQEVNQFVPFYFSTKHDGFYNQATYINEEDFATGGPENAASAYDPTAANRKMFWLAHGYGTMGGGSLDSNGNKVPNIASAVKWKPSTNYHRYQEIIVPDSTGQPWTFYGLDKTWNPDTATGTADTVSGTTTPAWNFTEGATTTDADLVWTCVGKFTADLGVVIGVGGDNSPSTGWIARIGTVMEEEGDYIYNAIFDMSKAQFDPSVTHVFARMQKDMFLDLTADGTQAGQNNRLFGYDSSSNSLTYKLGTSVNGGSSATVPFSINDSGVTKIGTMSIGDDATLISNGRMLVKAYDIDGSIPTSSFSLRFDYPYVHLFIDSADFGRIQTDTNVFSMSNSSILAISSPNEGRVIYSTDNHEKVTYSCPTTANCGWYNNDNYNISIISSLSAEGLTSTGSTISDSLMLSSVTNIVTTSTSGSGVQLPNIIPGTEIVILNRSTNAINVYPDSSSNQIESLGAGVAQDIEPNSSITFIKTSSTEWRIK